MKTIDTNTTVTTTGTTTGTAKTGKKFSCIGGTSTYTPETTGTTAYGTTVSVPRSYIMTHLCGDAATVTSVGTELFGNPGSQYVNISKGILFYAILKEGQYAINLALPDNKICSPAEVAGIPMGFLTDNLRNSWASYVAKKVTTARAVTTSNVQTLWHDFVRSSFGPGFSATSTDPTCYNATKGVMLYTLYREGKACIANQFSGAKTVKMSFLPVELNASWEKTISNVCAKTPAPTMGDVIGCWRNFILENVASDSKAYATRFEMLMTPSQR